jgi:hypothetical protein
MNTKLRSMAVVISAALIGATAPGFAQARDGHRGGSHYSGGHHDYRGGHRGGSSGLGLALGLGLLGVAIASQYSAPQYVPQPYGYAPAYPPAPVYGYDSYGYAQPQVQYSYPAPRYYGGYGY